MFGLITSAIVLFTTVVGYGVTAEKNRRLKNQTICGEKPKNASTKVFEEWQDCIEQVTTSIDNEAKSELNQLKKTEKRNKIFFISSVGLALIIIAILIYKKYK